MPQALSLFNLLINVSQLPLQMVVLVLLVERSHAELLVGKRLILPSRRPLIFSSRPHVRFLLSRLDGSIAVPLENVHLLAAASKASDGFAEELRHYVEFSVGFRSAEEYFSNFS